VCATRDEATPSERRASERNEPSPGASRHVRRAASRELKIIASRRRCPDG
jgi:hypothetical protein